MCMAGARGGYSTARMRATSAATGDPLPSYLWVWPDSKEDEHRVYVRRTFAVLVRTC